MDSHYARLEVSGVGQSFSPSSALSTPMPLGLTMLVWNNRGIGKRHKAEERKESYPIHETGLYLKIPSLDHPW